MPSTLPRGIYYDKLRNRWRIRIYKGQKVLFTKYCTSLPEALIIHAEGIQLREQPASVEPPPTTPEAKFNSLYAHR